MAFLTSGYMLWSFIGRTSGSFGERMMLLASRVLIDVVLVAFVLGIVYAMAAMLVRSVRWRLILVRLSVATAYVVLLAQMLFHGETGMFFSGDVALYALSHMGELSSVLAGSAATPSSGLIVVLVIVVFVAPMLLRGRRFWAMVAVPLLLPALVVLISQLGVANMEGAGRRLAADSAFVALLQPPYPDVAGGSIPVYEPPVAVHPADTSVDPPDIVLVVLESTRAISVPPFDSGRGPRADMPILRELAGRSRIFTRTYTTTSHTSKALVGMLCGVHPHPDMPIVEARPDGIPGACLPRLLVQGGYSTLFIQSATEKFENRPELVSNAGFQAGLYKEQIADGHASSGYFGLDEAAIPPRFAEWWNAQGEAPRFATLLTSMTHHPYQEVGKPAPADAAGQLQGYLNVLNYTDGMLGQVLDVIAASGRAGNTILIVTGDHGESFGEHGPRQHDSVPFEEVTRVPLLVWDGRGILPTGTDTELRQHVDLMPTVLRLAGGHIESGPGRDLFDVTGHPRVITSCWYAGACMSKVTPALKWIYAPASRQLLAFDLAVDPDELNDISGTYPLAVRQDVAMELLRHQESVRRFHDAGKEQDVSP